MSIELRWENDDLVCDYGAFEFGDPRPDRDEVGPLMLVTADYLKELMEDRRPQAASGGALHQVVADGDRLFAHVHYFGKHWVWELFEAHFQDGEGPEIYVGRWPD